MTARAYLGRRRLAAAVLVLTVALAGSTAGASRAPAAESRVTATCGYQTTGNGAELITAWRFTACSYVAYAWADTVVAKSPNGWDIAIWQTDGNLVVYSGATPVWASNTSAVNGSVYFGYDGNVSTKATPSSSSATLWSSSNYFGALGPMRLVMWNGGNLVIYNANWKPYWSSFAGTYYS